MLPKHATLAALRDGLASKTFSAVELAKEYLTRSKKDPYNAFTTLNDRAVEEAKRADQAREKGAAGPLAGIPIAVKDVIVTKGLATTAASRILEGYVPPFSATVVERLAASGMIVLGKTNCDEFAMGSSNENSAFGPVKNPIDTERVPGGSSGGSAVAVAAEYAPVALGTDTGGSVRLPASFCGIVGFKPTYGRVSRYGLIAMASSLDQVGTLTNSVSDAAVLLHEFAGSDPRDATSSPRAVDDYEAEIKKPLGGVTIGIVREFQSDQPAVESLMERARERFKKVGKVRFADVSLPKISYALAVYYICMSSEVSANLARYDGLRYGRFEEGPGSLEAVYRRNRAAGFGPEVRRRIMLGTYALSAGYYDAYYLKAQKVRRLIAEDFIAAFKSVDAVMSPTSPTPAFRIGEKQSDPLTMYLSDIYTVAANLAGLPAISVPCGTEGSLPMGLQLTGPAWSESALLRLAHHFENAGK
jgi:aspartyl-tRNA(Asn)/glutamyl-tRNA(Gln) amidotransferase subunit A